jgi:hypothetical protein
MSSRTTSRPGAVSSRYSRALVGSVNRSRLRECTAYSRRTSVRVRWEMDLGLGSTAATVVVRAIAWRNAGRSGSR